MMHWWLSVVRKVWSYYRSIGISYKLLKRLWEPGFESFVHQVVRAWARFTCLTFSFIGQNLWAFLVCFVGVLVCVVLLLLFLTNHCDRVVYRWLFLAQLHDCHSCYDERSIDQKKDLILEPVSGPIPASLEGASIVSPQGSASLLAGLSLT